MTNFAEFTFHALRCIARRRARSRSPPSGFMAPFCARGYHVPYLVELRGGSVRRIWLRVALAAGAGLASLVVCSGVLVAIVVLFSNTADVFVIMGSGSWPS